MTTYLTVVSAFGRLCGHTMQLTRVNFLFVVFGFPLASRLVFILHIYICSSRTCEKNCHILVGCLFVNLRLTHEPCLGITIVSLYCFYGGPQLSRQKLIPRGKRKLLTAKENYPRQKEKPRGKKKNLAAKRKRLTAKRKDSRQKEKPRGKKKNLAAKRKTSRQKEKPRGKKKKTRGKKKRLTEKRKTDSRQKKKGLGGWPSFSKYSTGKKKKQLKRG